MRILGMPKTGCRVRVIIPEPALLAGSRREKETRKETRSKERERTALGDVAERSF